MIRHILLIAFKPGTLPAQIDAVRAAFLAIPHLVSGVLAVEWGRDDSPE
ncbi:MULTISPECIES: Dabb family protein, partial [Aeromonas]